ncbi:amylo-alpha-1,6-glucosidase [Dactylosporangium matsuzakiense]|uniref:Glycogen debranching protein n=1 Tax=Dactylosporangium matsuzakiense TaxID=53360 RepID=A0A9W6KF05_9ACTN|nr:amylo-alpha-1,6-glucosidase [Dactylosporangium matsuzakiense]GLK99646.1 glycogen debranching protein [Dactylosporangium matsuzakiense]
MPPGSVMTFGPHACATPAGFEGEWLVTDGLGGYATGTIAGLRTRRYHALLVTPARQVALAALDPVLRLPGGAEHRLAVHEWGSGALDPTGHHHLESFDIVDGVPRWRWRFGGYVLEREVAMVYGRNAVAVVHRLVAAPPGAQVRLVLGALCTWRDADGERFSSGGELVVEDVMRLDGPGFKPVGEWYLDAYHREEAARGLNPVEDLWAAGTFTADLRAGETLTVTARSDVEDPTPLPDGPAIVEAARRRARKLIRQAGARGFEDRLLTLAADAFIIQRDGHPDVVAGYPWFGSYLRDTMTAYEGLFLDTNRAAEGRALLRSHAGLGARMRAEALADADGPLWYVHAVDRHIARTGDDSLAAELLPAVESVVAAYTKGTMDGVTIDALDGLLRLDADHGGRTWMNAHLPRGPVTPRDGKPVELNALWANALGALAALRERCGRDASVVHARRDAVRAQFVKRFRAPDGWLFDVVDAGPAPYPKGGSGVHDDSVLRPNQLLAFSLPYAPAADETRLRDDVLRAVGESLLTPLGLRTLAPGEYGYLGGHRGGVVARDTAYHQGTVWPWWLGPYADAMCAAGRPVDALPAALTGHLSECGLGSVSEIAEGDAPYRPTGAPFSARSVAALLHARTVIRQNCNVQAAQPAQSGKLKLAREAGPRKRRNALR